VTAAVAVVLYSLVDSNGVRKPDADKAVKDLRNVVRSHTHTHTCTHMYIYIYILNTITYIGNIRFSGIKQSSHNVYCLSCYVDLRPQAFVTPAHFCLQRTRQACELEEYANKLLIRCSCCTLNICFKMLLMLHISLTIIVHNFVHYLFCTHSVSSA
jgi:hypothetical protein